MSPRRRGYEGSDRGAGPNVYDASVTVLDPFDMLVRLGKITQENVQAADLVEAGVGTSTRAARLVAVGVDKEKLLAALSDLTRMPIAPAEMLERAAPMKLPDSYRTTMKELLAVPIGRVDEHILDIAIADPRTTTKLRDAAIAHRPRLALEPDILAALERVFPEEEVLDPIHEPTLKNVQLAPRPITVDGDADDPGVPRNAVAAPAEATSKSDEEHDLAPRPAAADVDTATKARPPKPLSPFDLTKEDGEPTQRVHRRSKEASPDEALLVAHDAHDATGTSALSAPQRALQRARAMIDDLRARLATMNAKTRMALAAIAAVTALCVIAILARAGPDEDDVAATTDAGIAADLDAGTPESPPDASVAAAPVVEKPIGEQPQKRKKKKKSSKRRTQKQRSAR